MVEEAARVTMQELKGLRGRDGTHWRKAAQLVEWSARLFNIYPWHSRFPPHLIAIDMHMVDPAIIVATQTWPPFNQMMTAREADVKDHPWYRLRHQPKSHPYYKVMEELTGPSSRAEHQAQPVDKGKGKELGTDEAQGTRLPDIMAKTTGVAMQKPGNEEDQNREKALGPPVEAWSRSRRPTKKAKPVDEDVQDRRDINNPPKSWEELALYGASWQGMLAMPLYEILMQLVQGEGRQVRDAAKSLPIKASPATIPRRHRRPSHHFNACCASSIDQVDEPNVKGHQAEINPPGPSKITSRHSSPGPRTGRPMEIITPSWLSRSRSRARSAATDPPITPAPTTTTGADDPCHCDEYREEVTILKRENADMRREIEVTRTELAALHRVVDAIRNHLFPAPDVLNHPLVPFHATSNPTPRFNHPEAAQDRSPLNPPPASFEGGAGLEVPPSNVEPVHGPAGGPAISITPPPPAVGSAPEQEGRMEVD
ncbi:hypothetical protein BKA82DRAFT_4358659 [Pisolithus tinctorius]|nr:hypothetical protein BKA82DRAFT_4358659 [Pisolithus tinctorius]